MRVPAVVTIAIVALCATTGLVLGWLFPLNPSLHNEVEHSQVATASPVTAGGVSEPMERLAPEDRIIIGEDEHLTVPLVSPTAVPHDVSSSDGPTVSATHVPEGDRAPSASGVAALPTVAGPGTPEAARQHKIDAPQANSLKNAKEPKRRSTKEMQKAAHHRPRPKRDDNPTQEKQPTRSIISQVPIVGPVFGFLVP
jgi:hypothetical protein